MKYDLAKPATRGARRTLEAFRRAMLDALREQPFESVTVNALCERADYPRATFYKLLRRQIRSPRLRVAQRGRRRRHRRCRERPV